MNSLCVCFTPLNVLLAKRVSQVNKQEFQRGLFITSVDSEKQKYYSTLMKEFCKHVDYLIVPSFDIHFKPKHLSIFLRRRNYRLFFKKYAEYDTLFCPGTYNDYYYALLSAWSFKHLYTYDDGLINIYDDGTLVRNPVFISKLFLLSAGIKYWPVKIRARSEMHFTIYDAKHSFPRLKKIELFPNEADQNSRQLIIKRVFLGALPEASEEMWSAIRESIKNIKPDGYIPHPREVIKKIDHVEYINTPLIAEDYILTNLQNNPEIGYEVYGYDTSALFNLAGAARVQVISVLPDLPQHQPLRRLMTEAGVRLFA